MSGDALFSDPKVDSVLAALKRIEGWPYDPIVDEKFARRLIADYPSLNLSETLQKFEVWWLDNPAPTRGKKKINWRSRVVTWCRNEVSYARGKRERGHGPSDGNHRTGQGPSSRAGSVEEFGESRRLDRW